MPVYDSKGREIDVRVEVYGRWHKVAEIHQDGATGLGYETDTGELYASSQVTQIRSSLVNPPRFWRPSELPKVDE